MNKNPRKQSGSNDIQFYEDRRVDEKNKAFFYDRILSGCT